MWGYKGKGGCLKEGIIKGHAKSHIYGHGGCEDKRGKEVA